MSIFKNFIGDSVGLTKTQERLKIEAEQELRNLVENELVDTDFEFLHNFNSLRFGVKESFCRYYGEEVQDRCFDTELEELKEENIDELEKAEKDIEEKEIELENDGIDVDDFDWSSYRVEVDIAKSNLYEIDECIEVLDEVLDGDKYDVQYYFEYYLNLFNNNKNLKDIFSRENDQQPNINSYPDNFIDFIAVLTDIVEDIEIEVEEKE